MDAASREGHTPVFVFFYSGHGSRHQGSEAALTLLDGSLSQTALHEQIIDKVHAQLVHLVIDACHAEAVVRPRDVDAKTIDVAPADLVAQLSRTASDRYPQVGLVVAGSGTALTHEWDVFQSGVFTHEVISGLRGAADVNHDGRVEYSELGAFLTAANREVVDPRARLQSIVQPPVMRPHAALINLVAPPAAGWLTGIPASAGRFFVEDVRGNRIIDGNPEVGSSMSVAVPSGQTLFVRNGDREAEFHVEDGVQMRFDALAFRQRPLRMRGAVETSLQAGLFLMPYGPAYYSGYVDRREEVAVEHLPPAASPISLTSDASSTSLAPSRVEGTPRTSKLVTLSLWGASGAFLATSAIFGGMAWSAHQDFQNTTWQAEAVDASNRYRIDSIQAWAFFVPGVACGLVAYLLGRRH
jgi:hypothetical protein